MRTTNPVNQNKAFAFAFPLVLECMEFKDKLHAFCAARLEYDLAERFFAISGRMAVGVQKIR